MVLSLVAGADADLVFMPLDINGNHWTCIVVDKVKHKIYCYDSMDKRANRNLLEELADELLKKNMSHPCEIITQSKKTESTVAFSLASSFGVNFSKKPRMISLKPGWFDDVGIF
ncbi:hypothetical protein PI125_g471 [Phytophthora idaei]|nr:hypothetical protein PI125_g471 [Phytophthora idaei]